MTLKSHECFSVVFLSDDEQRDLKARFGADYSWAALSELSAAVEVPKSNRVVNVVVPKGFLTTGLANPVKSRLPGRVESVAGKSIGRAEWLIYDYLKLADEKALKALQLSDAERTAILGDLKSQLQRVCPGLSAAEQGGKHPEEHIIDEKELRTMMRRDRHHIVVSEARWDGSNALVAPVRRSPGLSHSENRSFLTRCLAAVVGLGSAAVYLATCGVADLRNCNEVYPGMPPRYVGFDSFERSPAPSLTMQVDYNGRGGVV